MCGIAGIFAYHYAANAIDCNELQRIREHMVARGPDGAGTWLSDDGRIGLAHRRLSIIDLSDAGAQPMVSADRKLVVTFNGEIYNYRQLKRSLEANGHIFRSESDTEVLLHLYRARGAEMVRDLRGMFAFALWDGQTRTLLMARDPYGIKPLYYSNDGWTLRFASQVKALLSGGRISHDVEPAGWAGYYLWGSVPEPFTTYRDIRSVESGSTIVVNALGPMESRRYYSLGQVYVDAEARPVVASGAEIQDRTRAAVLDSVRHHLVADVPVGAFLSAGIDSGALVGLMRDAGQINLRTVTLEFSEFSGTENEGPLAATAAKVYATQHTRRVVTEEEFQDDLPRILDAMDQPTIDGVNTWFVSKAAREMGLKVAVSGLGGDELFGGYRSFGDIPRSVRWFWLPSKIPGLGAMVRKGLGCLARGFDLMHPKSAGLVELGGSYAGAYMLRRGLFMPWELGSVMDPGMANDGLRRLAPLVRLGASVKPAPRSAFARVAVLESSNYMRNQLLRDTDWASMAHSLEVRVPLVDAQLTNAIAPMTVGGLIANKRILASCPQTPLPPEIIDRPKTGFATPIAGWQEKQVHLRPFRAVPALASAKCPWARRWAYSVASPVAAN